MRYSSFAVFYRLTTAPDGHTSYVEGTGDRSVTILDGRMSLRNQKIVAIGWAEKHKWDGLRIARGTFTNPFYLTAAVIPVVYDSNGVADIRATLNENSIIATLKRRRKHWEIVQEMLDAGTMPEHRIAAAREFVKLNRIRNK